MFEDMRSRRDPRLQVALTKLRLIERQAWTIQKFVNSGLFEQVADILTELKAAVYNYQ